MRTNLERIKAYVADGQWDEAVESLRRLDGNRRRQDDRHHPQPLRQPGRLLPGADCRLPPEALALYRERVDASAQALYDEAIAQRDADRLANWSTRCFSSSRGDDACGRWAKSNWSAGTTAPPAAHWEALIELPPGRVPARFFEAARSRSWQPERGRGARQVVRAG